SHSIHESFSAADYERYALDKVQELFQKHDTVVMVGGTGLYIKAFCEGLDEIPASDENIRQDIIRQYEEKGMGWLQQTIQEQDPVFFAHGEIHNPQRVMRALEVKLATGLSITSLRSGQKKKRDFHIIKAAIELPREVLYGRINQRVDQMMEAGLLKEAESLLPYKQLNALQTVGYKEIFSFLDNEISLPRAIELIQQNTRHYAKRQMTWFKKDEEFEWGTAEQLNEKLKIKN
ncbi:tRNA (adenosine(37)-N6)-dimethylallyltransferase MiaA, partial [Ferruginibacter sp. HRS2-29]